MHTIAIYVKDAFKSDIRWQYFFRYGQLDDIFFQSKLEDDANASKVSA